MYELYGNLFQKSIYSLMKDFQWVRSRDQHIFPSRIVEYKGTRSPLNSEPGSFGRFSLESDQLLFGFHTGIEFLFIQANINRERSQFFHGKELSIT